MKLRRSYAAVVLAMLAALVLALPASGSPLVTLEAHLTGEQEVPGPGDPNGSGDAVLKVFKARVCYTLKVRRIARRPTSTWVCAGRPAPLSRPSSRPRMAPPSGAWRCLER
jgi:hypothetical protein